MNDELIPSLVPVSEPEKPQVQAQSLGGIARAKKLTPEERRQIAVSAAEARWEKDGGLSTHRATHESETLTLGETAVSCAVLDDGTRLISSAGMMKAIGRPWKGTYRRDTRPNFLSGPNLEPLIDDELRGLLNPITYRSRSGGIQKGYRAELLQKICEVYLKAREKGGVLTAKQLETAQSCEIIIRALARVGIVALIDEATGYQEVRDRFALQEILKKYISGALLEWTKTFPLDFYKEIFRLKGWKWNSGKMPGVVGKYTNDLVYERLAPGVLAELQRKNPVTEKGYRKYRHHQYLTEDVGHPELKRRLYELIGMARACDDNEWGRFYRLVDKHFQRVNATMALPLSD